MTISPRAPLEIGIVVADLDRVVDFYQRVLGFERISEATLAPDRAERIGFGRVEFRMVRMQTGYGERIKLIATVPAPAGQSTGGAVLARAGIAYLTFVVADLDAALQRLRAAGVQPLSAEPVQSRPGTRLVFLRDSEGNALELAQYDDLHAYRSDLTR
ncbi:MAG: VOC family protein [Lautropia sp.]